MGRFADNAVKILETAESVMEGNPGPTELTILIGSEGGIRMIRDSDWPLETLQAAHGAEMVYRVRQQGDAVRLEGRAGSRTCLFETGKLGGVALGFRRGSESSLLAQHPMSEQSNRLLRPVLPPAYEVVGESGSRTDLALPTQPAKQLAAALGRR